MKKEEEQQRESKSQKAVPMKVGKKGGGYLSNQPHKSTIKEIEGGI